MSYVTVTFKNGMEVRSQAPQPVTPVAKLTAKERKLVRATAAYLARGGSIAFSCDALNHLSGFCGYSGDNPLVQKYQRFYGHDEYRFWPEIFAAQLEGVDLRELRVLLLLTFAEVG